MKETPFKSTFFKSLKNEEHQLLHFNIASLIGKNIAYFSIFDKLYERYLLAVEEERHHLRLEKPQKYTSQIREADKKRSKTFAYLKRNVIYSYRYRDPVFKDIVHPLFELMEKQKNVSRLSMDERTHVLDNLLIRFKAEYLQQACQQCMIGELIERLTQENDEFKDFCRLRAFSKYQQKDFRFADFRQETDTALRKITDLLYSMLVLAKAEIYLSGDLQRLERLIGLIRTAIENKKRLLARRAARLGKK